VYSNTTEAYQDMRRRSKKSLYYFAKTICGMTDLKDSFHKPFANYVSLYPWNGGPQSSNRKIAVMPREHFKSSISTVARAIWLLIHNRSYTICLMSAKEDHPKKWLRQIKYIIEENPIFRSVFPEISPDYTKWDDTEILIKRPPSLSGQAQASITAASLIAGQASQHFDHILLDDPVNERISKSETLMKQVVDNFDHLESLLKGWQTSSFDLVGTPWGRGDCIEHAMKYDVELGARLFWFLGARGEFKMSPELMESHPECAPKLKIGPAIFPERVNETKLERLEKTDPEKYYLQYLCKPYDAGMNGFDLDLFRDFAYMSTGQCKCECHPEHDHAISRMSLIILSDPAVTLEKKNCQSSVLVVGKAACGCRFLFSEWGDHVMPPELLRELTRTAEEWQPWAKAMGIESVSFQRVFKHWLLEKQSNGEFPLNVQFYDPAPKGRGKDDRISAQLTSVNNGLWHKRPTMKHVEGVNNFMDQLSKWPYGEFRDLIDGWAYCDDVWEEAPPPGKGAVSKENTTLARNIARERFDRAIMAQSEE
jgi:hypothetical protein